MPVAFSVNREHAIKRLRNQLPPPERGHGVETLSFVSAGMQEAWKKKNPGSDRVQFTGAFFSGTDPNKRPNLNDFKEFIKSQKEKGPKRLLIPLAIQGGVGVGHACGLIVDIDANGKANILFFNPMGEMEGNPSAYRNKAQGFIDVIQTKFPNGECNNAKADWQCQEYEYCGDWTMWFLNQAATSPQGYGDILPSQAKLMSAQKGDHDKWLGFIKEKRKENIEIIDHNTENITFEFPIKEQPERGIVQMDWDELATEEGKETYKAYLENDQLPYRQAEIVALNKYIEDLKNEVNKEKDSELKTSLSGEIINAEECVRILKEKPINFEQYIVVRGEGVDFSEKSQKRRNELAQAKQPAKSQGAEGSTSADKFNVGIRTKLMDLEKSEEEALEDVEDNPLLILREKGKKDNEVKEGDVPNNAADNDFHKVLERAIKIDQGDKYDKETSQDQTKQAHFENKVKAILDELNKLNPADEGDKARLNALKSMLLSMRSLSRNQVRYTEAHFNKKVNELMSGASEADKKLVKDALKNELGYYFYKPGKPGEKRKSTDFAVTGGERVFPKNLKTHPGVKIEHKRGGSEVIGTFSYSRGKIVGEVKGVANSPEEEYKKFRKQIRDFANIAIDEYGKGTKQKPIKIYFTGKEERPEAAFELIMEFKRRAMLEGRDFHAVYEDPPGTRRDVLISKDDSLSIAELSYLKHFANKKPKIDKKEMNHCVGAKMYEQAGLKPPVGNKDALSDPEILAFFNKVKPTLSVPQDEERESSMSLRGNK